MFITPYGNQDGYLTQYFYNAGTYLWQKPIGVSLITIVCVGAGADGQAGTTAAIGASKNGGSGGGSGGVTTCVFSASMLPEYLNINLGKSQTYGTSSALSDSWVAAATSNRVGNTSRFVFAYARGSNGSSAGAAATTTQMVAGTLGHVTTLAGIGRNPGGSGGTAATNDSTLSNVNFWMTSGAGGSGGGSSSSATYTTGAGIANITGSNLITAGGNVGTGIIAGRGAQIYKPIMIFTGGAGGGGCTTVAGGAGGDGAPGCGGGGGGGGTTGGAGGKGGDGFVIISCK